MSEQLQAGDKNGQVKGSEKWIRAFRNFCFAKNAKSLSTPILPYVIAATGKRNLSEDRFGCSKGQIACTFKHFLKQIIKQWQKKAGKNTPLILMTGLYEGVDQIITETALNMQKEFSCLKVMAVMPQKENDFSKRFNNEDQSKKYQELILRLTDEQSKYYRSRSITHFDKELSLNNPGDDSPFSNDSQFDYETPVDSDSQPDSGTQLDYYTRLYYEFLAMHSHALFIIGDLLKERETSAESQKSNDDLSWLAQFKLEGLNRRTIHGFPDPLTYSSIGPIIHIVTERYGKRTYLPTHLYGDNEEITKENDKGERVIDVTMKKKDLSRKVLRKLFFGTANIIAQSPELKNCIAELGKLNRILQKQTKNKYYIGLAESFNSFIKKRRDPAKSKPVIDPRTKKVYTPDLDKLEQALQLMPHYEAFERMSNYYENKTKKATRWYCVFFFVIFLAGIVYTFFSTALFRGFDLASWKLQTVYAYQLLDDIPFEDMSVQQSEWARVNIAPWLKSPLFITEDDWKNLRKFAASPTCYGVLKENTCILTALNVSLVVMIACFILLLCTFVVSIVKKYHYRYHQFDILSECLQVQIFWYIARLKTSVPDNFRSHQIDSLDWLRVALNGLDVNLPQPKADDANWVMNIRYLDKVWIEPEKNKQLQILGKLPLSALHNNTPWEKLKYLVGRISWTLYKIDRHPFLYYVKSLIILIFVTVLCFAPLIANFRTDRLIKAVEAQREPLYTTGMIFWVIYSVCASLGIIYFAWRRMKLDRHKLLRAEQLRTPFVYADYQLDRELNEYFKQLNSASENAAGSVPGISSKVAPPNKGAEPNLQTCQEVLQCLGQEVLAKNADWLLAAGEHALTLPR